MISPSSMGTMEEYPGAELSLSQLVYALEKRLGLMINRSCSDATLDIDEIDRATPKLTSISACICQLRNSLAPINRLPPEVLALIPTFRKHERDLISATAVCKYWRGTLISTHNLWNSIICSERADRRVIAPRVHAYFERSGSVPVKVQIPASASQSLSPYIKRISWLRMFLGHPSNLDKIEKHLCNGAPLLETLSLRVRNWGPTLVLPPTFVKAVLFYLSSLTVRGATLSLGPCQLPLLTRFTLETHVVSVTSAVLLDTLEQMPWLRVFEAKLDGSRQDSVPSNRVVTLPRLEWITITISEHRPTPLANAILPALCLPSAHRVNMRWITAPGAPLSPVLPVSFLERLPAFSATRKVSVDLDKDLNDVKFFGSHKSRLTLSINSVVPYAFGSSTFGGTPFDSVRKLQVRFRSPNVDSLFFVRFLRIMERLECLRMEQNTLWPLAYWIGSDGQAGICPALVALTVIDADFNKAKLYIQELEQVRERAGVPIPHVEIRYGWDDTDDDHYPPSTLYDN